MASNFVREPLNGEECDRLVNACITFREKLAIWTLLDTGLRVSEFCSLRRNNIQWQENHMIIWGKGGR
jgi:integrase/recombinase XerD